MKNKKKLNSPAIPYEEFVGKFLKDKKRSEAYLQVVIEEYLNDGDINIFLDSLKNIAIARGGVSKLAKKSGLNRESLYKALSPKGNPSFRNILNIMNSLGMKIKIESAN